MYFEQLIEYLLFISCLFILAGSMYITFKLRFVQLFFFPELRRMLKNSFEGNDQKEGRYTISPYKALFTAMSTTLGLSTIAGPVIAIQLGGPGVILGYLLTSFFGSAATYAEVSLSILHRKRLESGEVMGGPMQYIKSLISPLAAQWYAVGCLLLMVVWSSAQSNQLSSIFDSHLMGSFRIPVAVSGALIAILVFFTLIGGIKRVASLSAKLVPTMFCLYLFSSLWIIFANVDRLGEVTQTLIESAFGPYQLATGALVGGIMNSLRWGIFKGTQASEAGIGTQAIPHSMAETNDPVSQGMLAMISTYMSGFVAFLSGYVALITNTWQDPHLPLGMSMVAASFEQYFASFGIAIVAISALLFGFGTILGNSYNGSQCLGYLTNNKGIRYYFFVISCLVFIGSITEVKILWSKIDLVLAFMVIPHMSALLIYVHKQSHAILQGINRNIGHTPALIKEEI